MKFTLGWLKDHLETAASLAEITDALTRLGLEVEGVSDPGAALAPFRVAHVIEAAPHPAADKLRVCRVDAGEGEVQVVCGAPNARTGMRAVFAAPGTYVPGTGITLRVAAIRGVESHGMLVSERELMLSDAHEGIIELPEDAPVGAAYAAYAGLDDPVIEVAVTPNRQDCMGVAGIARDLAAAGLGRLVTPSIEPVAGAYPCPVPIRVEDPEGCPAFVGRVVKSVANGASPAWMQRRLRAIGLRPISALVDITNYISFDRGRPLHVYDLARLDGGLTARRAREGESVLALNGRTYVLDPEMTVIADARAVHDIGGIMGGEESSVSESTTSIVIECAYFDPARIGMTGRRLGITSDARTRFERGVDPGFLEPGMALATRMVLDLCGGSPSEVVVAGAIPRWDKQVTYRPQRTAALAGVDVPESEQRGILERLGFGVEPGERWRIAVPSWRRDVDGEADIVEEVARVAGFDRVPSTPLARASGVAPPTATPEQRVERRVRRAVAARGMAEAVTWSFIAPAEAEAFGEAPWRLENPISAELAVMRPSLLPGLLGAARRNLDRGATSVRLFELGRRYLGEGERATLGLVLAGERQAADWRGGPPRGFDLFDAKAEALAALAAAGAPVDRLQTAADPPGWLHPGRGGRLLLGKAELAVFGEPHPALMRAWGLEGALAVAELYLDAVPNARAVRTRSPFAPPALQPVRRDFAFLLAADAPAEPLLRAIRGAEPKLITEVALFDIFTGAGVPEGMKSLAVAVTLQPTGQSLTEDALEAISARIIAAAERLGARLRS